MRPVSQPAVTSEAAVEIDASLSALDQLTSYWWDGRLTCRELAEAAQGHARRAQLWLKAVAA